MKDYIPVSEVAKYLNVHPNTFLDWRKSGRFNAPYLNIAGRKLYSKADIDAYLASCKVTPGQ
jgi:excisionase family DNA binding protein